MYNHDYQPLLEANTIDETVSAFEVMEENCDASEAYFPNGTHGIDMFEWKQYCADLGSYAAIPDGYEHKSKFFRDGNGLTYDDTHYWQKPAAISCSADPPHVKHIVIRFRGCRLQIDWTGAMSEMMICKYEGFIPMP